MIIQRFKKLLLFVFNINITVLAATYVHAKDSSRLIKSMAITPDGKFLYEALVNGYTNWYKINSNDGSLTFINQRHESDLRNFFNGPDKITALVVTPNGRFLYTGLNTAYTNWYKINSNDGSLTFINQRHERDTVKNSPDTPIALAITPDGKFLYQALNNGYTNWYKINIDDGSLTFINQRHELYLGSPYKGVCGDPADRVTAMAVTLDSKFLYTGLSNAYTNWYRINSDGNLIFINQFRQP